MGEILSPNFAFGADAQVRPLAMLAIALASSAAVGADDWDWAAPHKARCSDGNQMQQQQCLTVEAGQVEARLNARYKELLRSLKQPEDLRKAQRAWLAFRAATCSFVTSGLQGPGGLHSIATSSCRINLAEKRIRDLAEYAEWNCNGCPPRK